MPTFNEVKGFLAAHGLNALEYPTPTPTVETAAQAVGCTPAEIAKTILFLVGGTPVVVVAAGDQRVLSSRLKQATGRSGKVLLPAADEVLLLTGYAPGGVCPFLLPDSLPVLLDRSLLRFATIYPAAGSDRSSVAISTSQLYTLTGGREVEVCEMRLEQTC
jgi:prolyl-tRNA editing enzyme YbaK/EbsC (Cys-tRNA(Pro) deacylase)